MNFLFWFCVGAATIGSVVIVALWIDHRWTKTQEALTIGYSTADGRRIEQECRQLQAGAMPAFPTKRVNGLPVPPPLLWGRHQLTPPAPRAKT
jgi:hypothetical protein